MRRQMVPGKSYRVATCTLHRCTLDKPGAGHRNGCACVATPPSTSTIRCCKACQRRLFAPHVAPAGSHWICANTAADGCAAADPLRKFSPAPASVSHSLKHQLPRKTLPRACQLAQLPRRPTQLGAAKAPPTRSKGAAHTVGCLCPYCTPQSVGSNPRRLVLGIVMFTVHRCGRAPLTSMPCITSNRRRACAPLA